MTALLKNQIRMRNTIGSLETAPLSPARSIVDPKSADMGGGLPRPIIMKRKVREEMIKV